MVLRMLFVQRGDKSLVFVPMRFFLFLATVVFVVDLVPGAKAQINSNSVSINLSATLPESLTIAASPTTVNFTLASSGVSAGSA